MTVNILTQCDSLQAIVNMGACALYVLTRLIIYFLFGGLRLGERQLMWTRLTQDAMVRGLLLVCLSTPGVLEIVTWFSVFGTFNFIHMLSLLSRDRFDLVRTRSKWCLSVAIFGHIC